MTDFHRMTVAATEVVMQTRTAGLEVAAAIVEAKRQRLRDEYDATPPFLGIFSREAQIKHMVDRFLTWKLPENFNPDGGVTFKKVGNQGTPYEYKHEPSGTNLLDGTQAEAMVRHMLEGLPEAST